MTYPTYIRLTITRVTTPGDRPSLMQATHLQPPIVRLFPLPIVIARQQLGEPYAQISDGPSMLLTCAEYFDDVVAAIEAASGRGDVVVKPVQREAIATAATDGAAHLHAAAAEAKAATDAAEIAAMAGPPRTGDLRIVQIGYDWRVECRTVNEDGWRWGRDGLGMGEILSHYKTREAAVEAIRVAGYIRRLVG